MMTIKKILLLCSLSLTTSTLFAQHATLHIAQVFHIGSGGGYDYLTVDTTSERLYVSHGTKVNILN